MLFWTKIVATFPDELVRDLIAHEMAHVHQTSIGYDTREMDRFECDEDADWRMEDWGFNATGMDDWMRENGHSRVIDIASLSKSSFRRLEKKAQRSGRY